MGRLKGLTLSLLLGLYASPPTPVEQELHQYLSKTQAAYLALCLQHAQHLGRLAGVSLCVSTSAFLFYLFFAGGGDEAAVLLCTSCPPFLSSLPPLRASLVLIGGSAGLQ